MQMYNINVLSMLHLIIILSASIVIKHHVEICYIILELDQLTREH